MNILRKTEHLKIYFILWASCFGVFIPCRAADGPPAVQGELAQKAFEKLNLQIGEKKLSTKECEKIGQVPPVGRDTKGREYNNHVEYDGCTYSLEFRNSSDMDFRNLTVECRLYYKVAESWRAKKRESNTAQKHLDYSFKIQNLPAKDEYSAETGPFVLASYSLPSGYYYNKGEAEVVESSPQGLWVRVFRTGADGSKTHIDFFEPPSLSSKVTW